MLLGFLRRYRFELYLSSFVALVFGSLIFPSPFFERYMDPLLTLANVIAGFGIISERRRYFKIYSVLVSGAVILEVMRFAFGAGDNIDLKLIRFAVLSLFYTIVTLEIIRQVWFASEVNKNVIFGVMGGYVSMGLIAFFIVLGIEISEPGSFLGLDNSTGTSQSENLFYFAYITLMTVGYGDITPVTILAQKASILIALLGQFYLVIITAVVVGKYINNELRRDTFERD